MPLGTVTWKYANAFKKLKKAIEDNKTEYERVRELETN
jgi:hypothetical protein